MGRRTRECYLCGSVYQYCPTCSQDKMKPAWMSEFHDENCKNIFDICTRFNMKLMSKSDAKDALDACDLSSKENFKSYVQRDIGAIFAEEPKKRGKRAELKLIEEAIDIEPEVVKHILESHEVVKQENE